MARRRQQPSRKTLSPGTPALSAPGPEASHLYERGQTVVPKKIRDAMGLEEGSKLVWNLQDGVAHVIALPKDPIRGARGILKGKGLTMKQFLAERNAERKRERELEAEEERRWRTYSTRPRH
jgi:AbrB family looped-hinge helix DNA binding protein